MPSTRYRHGESEFRILGSASLLDARIPLQINAVRLRGEGGRWRLLLRTTGDAESHQAAKCMENCQNPSSPRESHERRHYPQRANAAYQPRRALRAVGCMRLFGDGYELHKAT